MSVRRCPSCNHVATMNTCVIWMGVGQERCGCTDKWHEEYRREQRDATSSR